MIENKQLIKLPVCTQSGDQLGYIIRYGIDELEQSIRRYYIKPHQGIKSIFDKELIVTREQVIRIEKKKMVVEDAVLKVKSERRSRVASKGAIPAEG
ncbi:hypothetical protein KKG41_05970 [Patescibacteria group bacterium]|nr:hypothetical protein [Patescibacteria group bacterium]MBU1890963.1 hypothetical protein [Patescibacteria group bacterium]